MVRLLEGIRVLDLCKLIPGDIATAKLADLGADVVKVEEPPMGDYLRGLPPLLDDVGLLYQLLNRNKRSIGIDLRSDEGRAVFRRLLETADAIVEVSTPGRMKKMGLDFESLVAIKPDLVYCSVTGYGQDGPYRFLPSHGMNIDAAAGLIRVRWTDDRPELEAASALGTESGGVHAALGVLAGLLARDRTGQPQYIDAGCWDGAVSMNNTVALLANLGEAEAQLDVLDLGARYNVYGTADRKVLFVCPIEHKFWLTFCDDIGRPDLKERGAWDGPMDFGADDPTLRDEIQSAIGMRTAAEWMEIFEAHHVPVSPVLTPAEVAEDPHTVAREMLVDGPGATRASVKYLRLPLRVGSSPFEVRRPAPALGQHTAELLGEAGYDEEAISMLRTAGTVQGGANP